MKLIKRIGILFTTLVLTVATFLSGQATLSAFNLHTVKANELENGISSSNVLDDLENSEHFNKNDYAYNSSDTSLKVITVSEDNNGYLYIYVYQPWSNNLNLQATSINISTLTGDELDYKNYYLQYVNSYSVFYKYVVIDNNNGIIGPKVFEHLKDSEHIYEITEILRKYNEDYDKDLESDSKYEADSNKVEENTIEEVYFKVAKHFCFTIDATNDKKSLNVSDLDVIRVTDKFVGFLRYKNGWSYAPIYGEHNFHVDSHFVAFNTNFKIDKILEAQIEYKYQSWKFDSDFGSILTNNMGWKSTSEIKEKNLVIDYNSKQFLNSENYPAGWFGSALNEEFLCIQTTEDFLKEFKANSETTIFASRLLDVVELNEITGEALEEIESTQWFIRFAQFSYETNTSFDFWNDFYGVAETRVSNVQLLRLKFESDDVIYNLGVLDNKQTGSREPINEYKTYVFINENVRFIIGLIMVVALTLILWPFVAPIVTFIIKLTFKGFGFIFKGVITVITLPFKRVKKRRRK